MIALQEVFALPSHRWVDRWTHGYVLQVLAKSPSPLPRSRRNASFAISSYRYRQSGGKGHHHFFYVPHSGHVGHCRGFCFPSLFRAPLIDVSIPIPPFSKLPTPYLHPRIIMVNIRRSKFDVYRFFSNQLFLHLFKEQRNFGPFRSMIYLRAIIIRSVVNFDQTNSLAHSYLVRSHSKIESSVCNIH